jgi:hypothetical protein
MEQPNIFNSVDRELLKEMFSCHGHVSVALFHNKYRLSPGQIIRSIRKLDALGIIEEDDTSIGLNEKGREWVLNNRWIFFETSIKKDWTPKKLVSDNLNARNCLRTDLLPKMRRLNKEYFIKNFGEKGR